MSCKSEVIYNFGPITDLDAIVYGAARPGAKSQRCFNEDDKVKPSEVEEWSAFMKDKGVKRIISLLSDSEKETYEEPLLPALQAHFKVSAIDAKAPDAVKVAAKELQEAAAAGEKAVVHCWGGGGRTGLFVAGYVMAQHGKTAEEAAAAVESHAKAIGTSRRVDVEALKKAMA